MGGGGGGGGGHQLLQFIVAWQLTAHQLLQSLVACLILSAITVTEPGKSDIAHIKFPTHIIKQNETLHECMGRVQK